MKKSHAAIAQEIVQVRHPGTWIGVPRWTPYAGGFYTVDFGGGQELVSLESVRKWGAE